MTPKTDRRVLVLFAARSGTRAVRQMLMLSGVDIGHERWKVNGTFCGHLAVDDYWYSDRLDPRAVGMRRKTLEVDEVWHQVRHPLRVIESLATGPPPNAFWHWQEKHTGISLDDEAVDRSSRYWLRWNQIIDADPDVCWRYRVEDIEREWPEMCQRIGIPGAVRPEVKSDFGGLPLSKLRRERMHLEWSDLGRWEEPVRLLAKTYGYEE
jgi:hypothetical protein